MIDGRWHSLDLHHSISSAPAFLNRLHARYWHLEVFFLEQFLDRRRRDLFLAMFVVIEEADAEHENVRVFVDDAHARQSHIDAVVTLAVAVLPVHSARDYHTSLAQLTFDGQ